MRQAIAKARQGVRKGQTPFGAVIVKNGRVIAAAHNIVWKSTDITAHAEINAIRMACRKLRSIDLSGCEIYSTCEPCPMCFSACHWARIDRIYYGCGIREATRAGFNELFISNREMKRKGKSPLLSKGGLLRKENAALFTLWKRSQNRGSY